MKTINKFTLITGLVAAATLGSCKKDFLDQKPYTSVPTDEAITTASGMAAALNGAYSSLNAVDVYGRTLPLIGDLLGDNTFVSVANAGRYTSYNSYSVTVSDANVLGLWSSTYTDILYANNIINATVANSDQMRGEAYAIRALDYFNLVRAFAKPYSDDPSSPGVPLITKYDKTALPARAKVSEVYALIMSDLDQAYKLMSTYRGSAYFSKYAARALAAKVALNMGDYENAYTYAKDVISNSGFSLVSQANLINYFGVPDPQGAGSQTETLFEVGADKTNNNSTDELYNMYMQTSPTGGTSYGDILASVNLYNLYSNTDVRKGLIIKGARARTGGENPAYIVNKILATTAGAYTSKKVIRLAEVYLIAAEAGARTGKGDALTLLNTLMSQRDSGTVYASTGTQLISDIVTERRKELAFEGDRFFDLNRLKLPILRSNEYPSSARTINYGDPRRVLPIPQNELNVNPNITQNPL